MIYYTLREAAQMVGTTYSRVWHVFALHRLPLPLRVGRTHLLTEADIEALKTYFSQDANRSPSQVPDRNMSQ